MLLQAESQFEVERLSGAKAHLIESRLRHDQSRALFDDFRLAHSANHQPATPKPEALSSSCTIFEPQLIAQNSRNAHERCFEICSFVPAVARRGPSTCRTTGLLQQLA